MGSQFPFLLLLAIFGLTTATINIKGTPENVEVFWSGNQIFDKIEVYLNDVKLIQEQVTGGIKHNTANASCQLDKKMCTIKNYNVTENDHYRATVTWNIPNSREPQEIETVDSTDNRTKSFVCVMGIATKPIITKLDDGSLVCTSKGYPAPIITWNDNTVENKTEIKNAAAVWEKSDYRFVASSTYDAKNQYISVYCTAQQIITDSCKNQQTSDKFENFKELSKPIISNSTNGLLTCESQGVPAPVLKWVNVSDVNQTLTTVNGEYFWNSTSIQFNTTNITNMTIRCVASQQHGNTSNHLDSEFELKTFANSAGKIDGPSVLVAALVAVVFFTRS